MTILIIIGVKIHGWVMQGVEVGGNGALVMRWTTSGMASWWRSLLVLADIQSSSSVAYDTWLI